MGPHRSHVGFNDSPSLSSNYQPGLEEASLPSSPHLAHPVAWLPGLDCPPSALSPPTTHAVCSHCILGGCSVTMATRRLPRLREAEDVTGLSELYSPRLQGCCSSRRGGLDLGLGFKCFRAYRLSQEPTVGGRLMTPIY